MSNESRPPCPNCHSNQILKNGSIHSGKQKYLCKICGRQFIENPTKKYIDDRTKEIIDNLLLERISLRGIARATEVSFKWLQNYVNDKYAQVPWEVEDIEEPEASDEEASGDSNESETIDKVNDKPEELDFIVLEADEMWSFVKYKINKVWIWLAMERHSRRIVGCYIGDRSRKSAQKLFDSLPKRYREKGIFYTDGLASYSVVIPPEQHRPVDKSTGQTNHIERFNNTVRQRVSRLVRRALSFSKDLFNHRSAIWYFIHHYNANLNTN